MYFVSRNWNPVIVDCEYSVFISLSKYSVFNSSLWIDNATVNLQQKVIVSNNYGEKLVGILHETGSKEIAVLCHGFKSMKVCSYLS